METTVLSDCLKDIVSERRAWNTELRIAQDEGKPAKIEGYAAVFDVLSDPMFGFRERVLPGAFKESLKNGADVRALVNHDSTQILGRNKAGTLRLHEDEHGLRISIDAPDTQVGRDVVTSIKRGDISQMSFAFKTIEDRWYTEDGEEIRELVKVELFDVSPVVYPAYPDTTVAVRALEQRKASMVKTSVGESKMETEKGEKNSLVELRERITTAYSEAESIRSRADQEGRDFTDDESKRIAQQLELAQKLEGDLNLRSKMESVKQAATASQGRQVAPFTPGRGGPDATRTAVPEFATVRDTGRGGYRNIGEYCMSVKTACMPGGHTDPRLYELRAPTTYGSEGAGTDGGFAVPPDFRTEILEKTANSETSLMRLCDPLTTISNSITVPIDQDAPWSTSGISGKWMAETAQGTEKKPLISQSTIPLHKYMVLVPMTDELLEDASAMNSYVPRKAAQKIEFAMNLAIVQGTGAGQPLGILNAPCLVSVNKVGSQTADTITGMNIITMYSRMNPASLTTAVWLINQDCLPYIYRLGFAGLTDAGAAATGWGSQLFFPPGGIPDSPAGRILGRPIIITQACETLGDKGDIFFADLSQYALVTKGGGIRTDISIHLYFDYDVTAFRIILRVGGQPWWGAAIAARDGTNTISPFVTLAERA